MNFIFVEINKRYLTELYKVYRSFDKEPNKLTEPLQSIWQLRRNTNVMKSFFNLNGSNTDLIE
jgi:hypothetical protein